MLALTRATHELREQLLLFGIRTEVPWSGNKLLTNSSAGDAGQTALLADTSSADDMLIGTLVHDDGIALNKAKVVCSVTH